MGSGNGLKQTSGTPMVIHPFPNYPPNPKKVLGGKKEMGQYKVDKKLVKYHSF